ncbi:MAG: hypothetical protein AB8G15_11960 [Saprospiraceae bacterium]
MLLEKQQINNLSFTAQDRAEYKKKGISLVEKIFPISTIQKIQASVEVNFKPEDQPEGVIEEFDRFSYDFANRDQLFRELAQVIVKPLQDLTGDELVVTQIAILELEVGKSKGFNWHFDTYSFGFIDIDAPGHTLWVPLNKIDINHQRGGMRWVHQNDFDGKGRLKQWEHYQLADKALKVPGGAYMKPKFSQYLDAYWTGEFDRVMLDDLQQECNVGIGDALVFNRHTWHKSQPMLPNGPQKKRTAITFRVVGKDSIINKTLFEKTMERMRLEGSVPAKSFGHQLAGFKDGDTIRDAINSGVSF